MNLSYIKIVTFPKITTTNTQTLQPLKISKGSLIRNIDNKVDICCGRKRWGGGGEREKVNT